MIVRAVNSTANLIDAKERAGLERAVGGIGFAQRKFPTEDKYELAKYHGEKLALLEMFEIDARPEHVEMLDTLRASEAWSNVSKMRFNAFNSVAVTEASLFYSVDEYFDAQTTLINALRDIELAAVQGISSLMSEVQSDAQAALTLVLVEAVLVVLIAIGLGFVFAQMLRGCLIRIRDAAKEMANGNLEVDLPQRTRNELGDIVEALSTFRDSILEGRKLEAELREQEEARALREREAEAEERQRQDEMREEGIERTTGQ